MPMPFKEREISKRFGEPFEVWFPRLLAEHKTEMKIAIVCDVYPNTVRNWKAKWQKMQKESRR